jgi:serine/threonine protein kinase
MTQTHAPGQLLAHNAVLRGRYRVDGLIAQGGMGAIYKALDGTFDNTVALKQTLASDPSLVRAFAREARLLNSLRHAALPVVIDYFDDPVGQFLVMQYIPGEDLKQTLDRTGRPFPVADVLRWADQLLDALEYLHGHTPAILHRDIKPHNLKLSARGDVILLDFGLAKDASGATTGGLEGSVFGYTPHYAPFEQILGRGTDPRSDLYALAATLFHLLTAQKPPDAMYRADAMMNGHPDPLSRASDLNPAVPPAVAEVLHAAMALNAAHRPPSAAALRAALREPGRTAFGDGGTVVETDLIPTVPRTPPAPSRFGWARTAALVASLALAAGTSVGWAATADAYSRLRRDASSSESDLRSELSSTKAALERERALRQEIAARWPLTVTDLKLRNELGGKPLGDYTTRFARSEVRYIYFHAKLNNNFVGVKALDGSLYVKVIGPDGRVEQGSDSPAGYSFKHDYEVSTTADAGEGWGNADGNSYEPGSYRLELWWDGRLVGAQQFVVYDDAP